MWACLYLILLLAGACPPAFRAQVMEDDIIYGTGTGKDQIKSYKILEKPFRMNKVNLIWEKARVKLGESKLVLLYSELKIQDKEELTLKKLKAESGDKDGMREAQIRKKMAGILNTYGLGGVPEVKGGTSSPTANLADDKALFKDKKLQRLWEKAEVSGLKEEERLALKMEFLHHQEKLEEFKRLSEMGARGSLTSNDLEEEEDFDAEHHKRHDNSLNGKAKEVKADFQRLHRLATNTHDKEFKSEQVQGESKKRIGILDILAPRLTITIIGEK